MLRLMTLCAVLCATTAQAHSPLKSSVPADAAVVSTVPQSLDMTFQNPIRLTRVAVAVNDGTATDLDLGSVDGFVLLYSLPITDQGAGDYAVEWRGLGDDGHPMQGTFRFTVE